MVLPAARPGLVFRYEYLWKRQALAGRTAGEKDRPACVVLSVAGEPGDRRVLIVPITTRNPGQDVAAIEIPSAVRRHLGFDPAVRSWIILSEANVDAWPSPDMRPIPGKPGCFEYGLLPLKLVNLVRESILSALTAERLDVVGRE